MKHLLKILLLLLPGLAFSQDLLFNQPTPKEADSLSAVLKHTGNDTLKMSISDYLANYYIESNISATQQYLNQALVLARKLNQKLTQASALDGLSYLAYKSGDYAESLQLANAGIAIAESSDCENNVWRVTQYAKDGDARKARVYILANLYQKLADLYIATGNNGKGLKSYLKALGLAKSVDDKVGMSFYYCDLGLYYIVAGKTDSAVFFVNRALLYCDQAGFKLYIGHDLDVLGLIFFQKANILTAKKYFFQAMEADKLQKNLRDLPYTYGNLAEAYMATQGIDSGIFYSRLALKDFTAQDNRQGISDTYDQLFELYRMSGRDDSAFFYLQRAKTFGDSLKTVQAAKVRQYLSVGFNEQLKVDELEKEKVATSARNRIYALLAGIAVFMLLALIFYWNNRQKQKANILLNQQKEEVQDALARLKETQTQLIQSEKMASLGELTAGIAHEIQNPLNFVNNFSEVNTELIGEMKEEIEKGDLEEIKAIAFDIAENSKKINMHGKRADGIVKSMLQHSQAASGGKEQANINQLAEECLQLSYHGFKTKDKSFNCEITTNFDSSLSLINIVKRDIGRALVNIYNNAFYAVGKKSKEEGEAYSPLVNTSTLRGKDKIIVKIKDNGAGMPAHIKEKIMQPFFTTKPTGEGTGLGLSLAYDIIVKGHGGNIDFNSINGEGSEFIVSLPC